MKARTRISTTSSAAYNWPLLQFEQAWLQHYFRYLPLLGIWLGFLFLTLIFLTQVSPAQVQNLLFANSYLPFHLLSFLSLSCLCIFVLLHTRRGLLVALYLQTLLFLKLQQFQITLELAAELVVFFVIIEALTSVGTFFFAHENVRQTPHRRPRNRHP